MSVCTIEPIQPECISEDCLELQATQTLEDRTPSTCSTQKSVPILSEPITSTIPVVETFLLTSIVLFASSMTSVLGEHLLTSSILSHMSPLAAITLSLVFIPLVTYFQLVNQNGSLILLILCGSFQGVLVGAALSHFAVFSEPVVIPSLLIAVPTLYIADGLEKSTTLAITGTTSIAFHLTLGSSLDTLTPIYILLSFLYTGITLIPIQTTSPTTSDQQAILLTSLFIGARCLVYGIFGVDVQ